MNFWQALRVVIYTVLNILLEFFPLADQAIIARISDQLAPLKGWISSAGWFFPVQDFFQVVSLVFAIEASVSLYKFVKFLVKNVSLGFIRD